MQPISYTNLGAIICSAVVAKAKKNLIYNA